MKFLTYKVAGVLQQDETGAPAQVGDQVKMFLDQQANPELPEFVFGIIQPGIRKAGCCDDYTIYKIGYELEDFTLRPDDIINLTTTAAVDVVAQDLFEETQRAIAAEAQLQENIDDEETARIEADNALDGRVDILEADAVRYTSQAESTARQEQARANLGMANRTLSDSSAAASVNWESRTLQATGGVTINYGLSRLIWNSGTVLDWTGGDLSLTDGVDLFLGTGTGTKIGTTTAQKVGFHGATPTIQRAGADQIAVPTTTLTVSNPPTQAEVQAVIDRLALLTTLGNENRATLVEKGIMKGSA